MMVTSAVLFLTGCVPEEPVSKVDQTNSQEQTAQQIAKEEQVFKVGDLVQVGDAQLKISEAKFVPAEQFNEAKNGKVLLLKVEAENKGKSAYFITEFDFNLYDEQGNKLSEYFSTQYEHLPGELNAGKKSAGYLTYDVKEASKYELVYKPNLFTDQEIKFIIEPQK